MRASRAAALLFLLAAPAAAQDEPASRAAAETDPQIIELSGRLKSDPAMLEAVAQRVARSGLIGQISTDASPDARLAAAREWIAKDPDSAAHVAIGLTADDQRGAPVYEDALLKQMRTTYGANPGAEKNLFGRLRRSAKDSKLLKKQAEELSPDEQREILRTLFEGKGAQGEKVIGMKDDGKSQTERPAAGPATAFNGLYDRLSAGNLHGYSPQLMALQSSLNARRAPGAPALVETGKLDYPTLSYPAYGMNYDIANLEHRLNSERLYALSQLAGHKLTPKDMQDPNLEAKLLTQVSADKLPPRFKARAEMAAKARAARDAFAAAAEKSKNPASITRGLLIELGKKQKEAARWIAAAALEEELSRNDSMASFPPPELLAAVDAVAAPEPARAAYKRRCDELKSAIARVKANAEKALALLRSDSWESSLADVDKLVAENQALRRTVARDVDNYSRVPYRVGESQVVQPRWRRKLDDLALSLAPTLEYSLKVARRRGDLARYLNVFGLIASGDANGAHAALTAIEPAGLRRP